MPRIFRYIGNLETKASSLGSNVGEKIDDKNADMDYHAVLPPDNKAGGDSKREELCQQDLQTITISATGASSSSEQTEATGASSKLWATGSYERSVKLR